MVKKKKRKKHNITTMNEWRDTVFGVPAAPLPSRYITLDRFFSPHTPPSLPKCHVIRWQVSPAADDSIFIQQGSTI